MADELAKIGPARKSELSRIWRRIRGLGIGLRERDCWSDWLRCSEVAKCSAFFCPETKSKIS
jgi:hypothetical protein